MLALIVGSTACVDSAVPDGGLERWRHPCFQRFGWLHIIVPIQQEGGTISAQPLSEHYRCAGGGQQICLEAHFTHPVFDIEGDVLKAFPGGADAWPGDVVEQTLHILVL